MRYNIELTYDEIITIYVALLNYSCDTYHGKDFIKQCDELCKYMYTNIQRISGEENE